MKLLANGIAVLENDTHISRWVEQCGRLCHDECVRLFILPLIQAGDVVVDAGAFIGDHTIAYLEKVGEGGRVWAFEPNSKAFECLAHNCPKAILQNSGLGESRARVGLSENENAGAARLCAETEGVSVEIISLDECKLDRLDFIKLDVEGFEISALLGAQETIARCRPVMVMEMCDGHLRRQGRSASELLRLLADWGYSYRSLNPGLDLDEPQLDLLCEPQK